MAKKSTVGGQAVMEGVMMRSPSWLAMAVRKPDGTIATEYRAYQTKAKKGTFLGLPIVRGVVSFVDSLVTGMKTLTDSAKLAGEGFDEEPSKFETWLSKKLGKSVETIVIGIAVILAIGLSFGLFFVLPNLVSSLIFGKMEVASIWKSLTEGFVRLLIFLGYIVLCTQVKDVRRVFMYHGAEHKTIACYEAEDELTPENAMKHSRLHPRCGTNYMFLVMAISILFFAVVGWNSNFFLRILTRLLFIPVVAGISYEVLMFAGKHDNWFTRIIRAPGMALQRLTTKEPTEDMVEVAIVAFNLAMDPEAVTAAMAEKEAQETASEGDVEGVPLPTDENNTEDAPLAPKTNYATDTQ